MNSLSKRILRTVALTSAILIFAANGIPAFASGGTGSNSPSYYSEEGEPGEGEPGEGEGEGGQDDTSSVISDPGVQQDNTALVREYSNRVKSALDELESHARAMVAAGNNGDRKKYDSEFKEYEKAERLVDKAINSSDGIPFDDASPIADQAYERLYAISKLCEQAEKALANSLGGAMDDDGKIYHLSKVSAKVSLVGKSDNIYDEALRAVGSFSNEKENKVVYRISLFVGKKPVHLIGGLTKSVTIGIPNDKIGRSPVTSYYLWDEGDGNHGASVAEKRGYFDKSTWCLTVKVSKSVTYYVVCGRPGSKGNVYGDDFVATLADGEKLTVDELREMLSAVRLEDGNEKKVKALEVLKPEGKTTAVFEIAPPEGVTLTPDAEAVADVVCPEAADKAVEIYRITQDQSEWVGTFLADNEGKLQFTTNALGVFVLCWQNEAKEETPAKVTPTDAVQTEEPSPVLLWVVGAIAAIAIIVGAEFALHRFIKK